MIIWTVDNVPVNINSLAASLIVMPKNKGQALLRDIGDVMSASYKLDRIDDEIPDGVCINCGEGQVTHADSLCDECVLNGLARCDCCQIEVDLTYLFNKHNIRVKFRRRMQKESQ